MTRKTWDGQQHSVGDEGDVAPGRPTTSSATSPSPQGFAADSDPPYGDDSGPDDPSYEPIRLPWECVEDVTDRALNQARVLDARNVLVCTATPRRARLIVSVVNRHASGFDV